jgi:hypothetical protein
VACFKGDAPCDCIADYERASVRLAKHVMRPRSFRTTFYDACQPGKQGKLLKKSFNSLREKC